MQHDKDKLMDHFESKLVTAVGNVFVGSCAPEFEIMVQFTRSVRETVLFDVIYAILAWGEFFCYPRVA